MKQENDEPYQKKRKVESNAWKMMEKMGYNEGSGLGAKSQGRVEPVEAAKHSGRLGIGITNENLGIVMPDTVWEEGMDSNMTIEHGDLLSTLGGSRLDLDKTDLESGKVIGERKMTIHDETTFCDPQLLQEMLKCKSVLDKHDMFLEPRRRCNPYEKLGNGIFLNRAAMKMLNMDYLLNGLFSKTLKDTTLYFADICAGPGGFTEYILWKRPMESCGFGFTLKGSCDFKIRDIQCGPVQCFHPSYGKHDDGDITNPENLDRFRQEVLDSTPQSLGVHTVMADGGFSVEGQESIQEILSKQLYLCQFLCAINILRAGGNFVCKLFDTFTDFSVGLIHLVSTLFKEVIIIKPITSRPANSERYVVFKQFTSQQDHAEEVRKYLYSVNSDLNHLKSTNKDVLKVIPHNIIKRDYQFYQFIKDINNRILKQQIIALAKLLAFIENRNLVDDRQYDLKIEAYKRWGIVDLKRDIYTSDIPNDNVKQLINLTYKNRFEKLLVEAKKPIGPLTQNDFLKEKFVIRNYYCGFISPPQEATTNDGGTVSTGSQIPSLFVLVKDKRNVQYYPTIQSAKPAKVTEHLRRWFLNLPSFTMLLVNFGVEFSGSKGNTRYNTVVIVDAMLIYSKDITGDSYLERMNQVKNLCFLLDPKQKGLIRPLDYFPFADFKTYLTDNLEKRKAKNLDEQQVITIKSTNHFFALGKLVIINTIKEPWMLAMSRTKGNIYYYNVQTRESLFEKPQTSVTNYCESNIFEVDCKVTNDNDFSCSKILESWSQKML